jgi:hypothetical protein
VRKQARSLFDTLGMRVLDLFCLATLVALALTASLAAHSLEIWSRSGFAVFGAARGHEGVIQLLKQLGPSHASYLGALGQAPLTSCAWLLGLLGAALIFSVLLGANRSSLHSLYSVRLIRAYLGSARQRRQVTWLTDLDPKDDIALDKLRSLQDSAKPPVLFQVANMTLNLARSGGHRRD